MLLKEEGYKQSLLLQTPKMIQTQKGLVINQDGARWYKVVSAPVKSRFLLNDERFKCKRKVKNGILCDICDCWYHFKCGNMPNCEKIDENKDWFCSNCVNNSGTSNANGSCQTVDKNREYSSALEIISILKNDIETLKGQNISLTNRSRNLENGKNSTTDDINDTIQNRPRTSSSCRPNAQGLNEVNGNTRSSLNSFNQEVNWNVVPKHKSFRPNINSLRDFPLISNKFEVLSIQENDPGDELL